MPKYILLAPLALLFTACDTFDSLSPEDLAKASQFGECVASCYVGVYEDATPAEIDSVSSAAAKAALSE